MNAQVIDALPQAGAVEVVTSKTAVEVLRKTALAELNAVDAGLTKLRRAYKNKTYAVDTTEGMDAAKKARADIRDRRYKLPHIVKAQKAAIRQVAEAIDSEGERIANALLELETPIHEQIKGEEDRKAAIKEAKDREARELQERVDAAIADIMGRPADVAGKAAANIALSIEALDGVEITLELYGESAGRVESVKAATLERLDAMHAAALAHEQEQAELAVKRAELDAERLRLEEFNRKEREEMDRQQREHNERMAAQRAELEQLTASTKAQADAIAQQAKEQRENKERIEREREQRATDVRNRIAAIQTLGTAHASAGSVVIQTAILTLQDTPATPSFFDDQVSAALEAKEASIKALCKQHVDAMERERLQDEQKEADARAAADLAAKNAALDAKRAVAEQLFDALAGVLACEELSHDLCGDTLRLIENANVVIDLATPIKESTQ